MFNPINVSTQNNYSPAFGNRVEKLITKLGTHGRNVTGQQCDALLQGLGCKFRQKGSHRIYTNSCGDTVSICAHNLKSQVKPKNKRDILHFVKRTASA